MKWQEYKVLCIYIHEINNLTNFSPQGHDCCFNIYAINVRVCLLLLQKKFISFSFENIFYFNIDVILLKSKTQSVINGMHGEIMAHSLYLRKIKAMNWAIIPTNMHPKILHTCRQASNRYSLDEFKIIHFNQNKSVGHTTLSPARDWQVINFAKCLSRRYDYELCG